MARLIQCFECGKEVSSEASRCPHCGTSKKYGVDCRICNIKLKESQAVRWSSGLNPYYYAHKVCFERLQIEPRPIEINCSLCNFSKTYVVVEPTYSGISLSLEALNSSDKCSNCGHKLSRPTNPYIKCSHCNILLEKSKGLATSDLSYVHRVCYENNPKYHEYQKDYQILITEREKSRKEKETLQNLLKKVGILTNKCIVFAFLSPFIGLGIYLILTSLKFVYAFSLGFTPLLLAASLYGCLQFIEAALKEKIEKL